MTAWQFWSFGIFVATTLLAGTGCRESSPVASPLDGGVHEAAYRDLDAKSLLQTVFHRYRSAESYRDSSRVRLAYDRGGRLESQWAPLSVCLDRGNFYVEAYSLRCYCDTRHTLAWIQDPSSDDFDGQVSVSEAPKARGDWEKLTLDPIFAQHLSAGLGGPPPQLDWLFAAEPMKGLFGEQQTFEFGPTDTIEGRPCQCVIVRADSQRYTFWVDRAASIVRRIELPSVIASPEPTDPPQEMTLTVELTGATFAPLTAPPTIQPLPTNPRYVSQFVPLPPEQPNPALGRELERSIAEPLGRAKAADRGASESLVILVCQVDPDASRSIMGWLGGWRARLPRELSDRVRLVQVGGDSYGADPKQGMIALDGDPEQWAQQLGLVKGGLAIVSPRGVLMWTHPQLFPHELPLLGTIVADVLADVDVPRRLRDDWQTAHEAYQAELKRRSQPPN